MPLKLYFDTRQAYPHPISIEICTDNDDNENEQPVNISLDESSGFGCRLRFTGDKIVLQKGQAAVDGGIGGGPEEKSSNNVMRRFCNHVKSFQGWQRNKRRASWHPQGSKLSSHGELLVKTHLAAHDANRSADLDYAAQDFVGQNVLSNGLLAISQPSPTARTSAHHPADCERWPCSDAQPKGHSRGLSVHHPVPFVGAVGRPPSRASQEVTSKATNGRDLKGFRGIRLVVPSLTRDAEVFTATMDTGADVNVISRQQAEFLGYKIDPQGKKTSIALVDGCKAESLGTIQMSFHLRCDQTLRQREFHVVEDPGEHDVLLSVELIMELGHLVRSDCRCGGPLL